MLCYSNDKCKCRPQVGRRHRCTQSSREVVPLGTALHQRSAKGSAPFAGGGYHRHSDTRKAVLRRSVPRHGHVPSDRLWSHALPQLSLRGPRPAPPVLSYSSPRRCSLCSAGSAPVSRALGPAGAHGPPPGPSRAVAPRLVRTWGSRSVGTGAPLLHLRCAHYKRTIPRGGAASLLWPSRGETPALHVGRRGAPSTALRSSGAARFGLGRAGRRGGAGLHSTRKLGPVAQRPALGSCPRASPAGGAPGPRLPPRRLTRQASRVRCSTKGRKRRAPVNAKALESGANGRFCEEKCSKCKAHPDIHLPIPRATQSLSR